MADIKQIHVNDATYDFKDEVARNRLDALQQEVEGKQEAIAQVTASVDSNVGTPSVTPTWNNGTLDFAFHNVKGEQGIQGIQGPQGDSVLVGQGDLPLAHVLGQDNTKAMSQKGVTDAINERVNIIDNDEDDFDILDENGYAIVQFSRGHIKTKNFDSSKTGEIGELPAVDFSIQDENGNNIVIFDEGHIRTKYFNSKNIFNNVLVKSDTLRYIKQNDNDYIFSNVGIIGNWVKETISTIPVITTYCGGAEILFQVKRTENVTATFVVDSGASAPTISYNIDDGNWETATVSSSVTIATSLTSDEHIVRIRLAAIELNDELYNSGIGALHFCGILVDNGGIIRPLSVNNKKILFIGDSLTAGARLNVWQGFSFVTSKKLYSQPIQSALSGGGLVNGSRSYLPKSIQIIKELIDGCDNVINCPDLIFICIGTNDGNATSAQVFKSNYVELLSYLRRRFGGCHIFACSPFNGTHLTDTQAAAAEFDNTTWIDTSDLANHYSTSDGVHPDASGALTCANFVVDEILKVINPSFFN